MEDFNGIISRPIFSSILTEAIYTLSTGDVCV